MHSSDRHALALAALTALGSDLVAMRGRVSKIFTDDDRDHDVHNVVERPERESRNRSKSSVRSRVSSSKSSRSTSSSSSCSSGKSLSKASRSKGKGKGKSKGVTKAKSTISKASTSKASTVGSSSTSGERERRRTTVLTVSSHPKPEKYVPPPRGTFRTSHTRLLRSDVIGALVSEIENLGMPETLPLITDSPDLPDNIAGSSLSAQQEQERQLIELPVQPPSGPLVVPINQLRIEDLPALSLAEFDFFSASRSRSSDLRETSPVWCRSPAAPLPPRVRRWLKDARKRPTGTLEEVDDSSSQATGTSRGGSSGA